MERAPDMVQRHGNKEWSITINGQEVENLFDAHGSETFDPFRAVEAVTMGGFIKIEEGDTIAFERIR
jgi:hypothetical protein